MSLSRLRKFARSFRFRIAASYFVLVILTSVVVFGFLYYLIVQTLREKDARIIESEFKRFALLEANEGTAGFEAWLKQKPSDENRGDLFVRLIDKDGKTVFEHDPAILREIGGDVFARAIDLAGNDTITRVEAPDDSEDAVEFKTGRLENQMRLQVGKDTEDREELLEKFRDAFGLTIFGALLTAIATGAFFSRSITSPIRDLVKTVNRVHGGDLKARAQNRKSGDELDELAHFLNGMLDQNAKLITALTESLDAVAHDLRTPLTKLRATAERASQTEGSAGESLRKEALGEILENTDQIIELINAIFDMSEAEAGAMKLRPRTFRMRDFLYDIVDVYSLIAEEKAIEIKLELPVDFEFSCDIRMKQALANLIDNAIKFSPSSTTIVLRAEQIDNKVKISVVDEGPGISADERERIFERLYRGDHSRSTRGMGLGLSLVRAVVKAHGGSVNVMSRNNSAKGSEFTLVFPDQARK